MMPLIRVGGYSLESDNFRIDPDDGTCSLCYANDAIVHVNDLREHGTLNFDICQTCITKIDHLLSSGYDA